MKASCAVEVLTYTFTCYYQQTHLLVLQESGTVLSVQSPPEVHDWAFHSPTLILAPDVYSYIIHEAVANPAMKKIVARMMNSKASFAQSEAVPHISICFHFLYYSILLSELSYVFLGNMFKNISEHSQVPQNSVQNYRRFKTDLLC